LQFARGETPAMTTATAQHLIATRRSPFPGDARGIVGARAARRGRADRHGHDLKISRDSLTAPPHRRHWVARSRVHRGGERRRRLSHRPNAAAGGASPSCLTVLCGSCHSRP
jgi:hypothetical protein